MIRTSSRLSVEETVERIAWQSLSYYPPLDRVRRYVEGHLNERITLRDAARVACLEYKYFSSFFHNRVNIRFTEWLRVERVMRSAELFRIQDITVAQAAREVGFRNRRTFERAFKRMIGITPAEFKSCVRPRNVAITKYDVYLTKSVANVTTPGVARGSR